MMEDDDYLQSHPAFELSLWQEWVLTVCRQREIPPPTGREWDALTAQWYHGKMPITSADELEQLRNKTPNAK